MTELEIAWLAGLLEGEGCFYFRRTPRIILQMTDEDVVRRASEVMDWNFRAGRVLPSGKTVYCADVCAERALAAMQAILPYMGIRRSAKIREVMAAAAARSGVAIGERAGSSKLTDLQAEEIIKSYVPKHRGRFGSLALSRKYGVSQASIWYTINMRQKR